MHPSQTTLALLAIGTIFILSTSVSLAAPIDRRHLEEPSSSRALHKRWVPSDDPFDFPIRQHPRPPVFLSRDGHAVFDDDDDDAGNEMLDTEELLLRPDADDEIEDTVEGQVLEIEEDDDEDELLEFGEDDDDNGEDSLRDVDLDVANHAFLDEDDYTFFQNLPSQNQYLKQQEQELQQKPLASPAITAAPAEQPKDVHPAVTTTRVDGARTRSRALNMV
ncbi:hypothetical protein DFQ26_009157 [Actinomortierella ambigua]|nr:hypothetical protein DFQ26_009157 [Actinomortierella ambigua]